VVVVHVTTRVPVRSLEADAFGRTVPFWPDASRTRWQGLVGLDVELGAGRHVVTVRAVASADSVVTTTHALEVVARTFAERHLRVDPRYSDPPPSARPRIAAEAARLEAIFGGISRDRTPEIPLDQPVPEPSSSPFGSRSFFNRQPRGRHNGVDFPSPAGTGVRAPGAGRVVLVDDLYFTGTTVVIDHGFGLYSLFAHLERATTEPGRDVARGDLVGLVGATGRATGPHLHWSARLQRARVDPLSLLAPQTGTAR
jgi:murein DD-endopeptidase MepM/ murein hydrolase activator NlpD